MIRRPPRSTQSRSSAASDVYKRQYYGILKCLVGACVEGPRRFWPDNFPCDRPQHACTRLPINHRPTDRRPSLHIPTDVPTDLPTNIIYQGVLFLCGFILVYVQKGQRRPVGVHGNPLCDGRRPGPPRTGRLRQAAFSVEHQRQSVSTVHGPQDYFMSAGLRRVPSI